MFHISGIIMARWKTRKKKYSQVVVLSFRILCLQKKCPVWIFEVLGMRRWCVPWHYGQHQMPHCPGKIWALRPRWGLYRILMCSWRAFSTVEKARREFRSSMTQRSTGKYALGEGSPIWTVLLMNLLQRLLVASKIRCDEGGEKVKCPDIQFPLLCSWKYLQVNGCAKLTSGCCIVCLCFVVRTSVLKSGGWFTYVKQTPLRPLGTMGLMFVWWVDVAMFFFSWEVLYLMLKLLLAVCRCGSRHVSLNASAFRWTVRFPHLQKEEK